MGLVERFKIFIRFAARFWKVFSELLFSSSKSASSQLDISSSELDISMTSGPFFSGSLLSGSR
jgi:hypothetical protein